MPRIISDDRARQGPSGRPVLLVLVGALSLCVVAFVGYMMWAGASSPDSPSQNASRQAVTGSPSGSSPNPTDRIPPADPTPPAPASPTATGSTPRP